MSTNTLPPIPADIAKLTGPNFIGIIFNWGLLGALGVQSYIYYLSFPNDKRLPKYLVVFSCVIELLQTVLVTRDAFRIFGPGWGNMLELDKVSWNWFSVPVLTAIISCTIQQFFAWRIYILSHGIWISLIVVVLSFVQMVGGVWAGVSAHLIGVFSQIQNRNYKQTSVWLGGTALVDVIITVSMIYLLSRSRTGFRTTNTLLTKIIRVTVETGLICSTFAVLDLAFFLAFKNFNYHLAPAISLSKLYTNSLLVLLNTRVRIVGGRNTGQAWGDTSLSTSFTFSTSENSTVHQLSRPNPSSGTKVLNTVGRDSIIIPMDVPMVHSTKFSQHSSNDDNPL